MSKEVAEKSFEFEVEIENLDFLNDEPYKSWTEKLQKDLSEKRYKHVLGVVKTARVLARKNGVSVEKATDASLLHDCAKKKEKFYYNHLEELGVQLRAFETSPVFHSYLGMLVAKYVYKVQDKDTLEAIEQHTTGDKQMSMLSKIIFLADMIEPSRKFEGVKILRKHSLEDINKTLLEALDATIIHLINQGVTIDIRSIEARNNLIETLKYNQ